MSAIVLDKVVKKYQDKTAVNKVSFSVKEGMVFGLLGPNGAGKTTIISMLTTLLPLTSGRALIGGHNVTREPEEVRKVIGLVFQETILDEDLSAFDNLETHARLYRVPKDIARNRIYELLELVGLGGEHKTKVHKFSGGMKRRLEIARGLIHHPQVLFLDEPTIGLDPKTRHMIWDYILKLKKDKHLTILLTTHYLEEADVLCDTVSIMKNGNIVVSGSPHDLKHSLGGDLIKVVVTSIDPDMVTQIKNLSYVKKFQINKNIITLTVDNGEERAVDLITLINSFPPNIKSLNLREPSLDDVFLYHTGEQFEAINSNSHILNKKC